MQFKTVFFSQPVFLIMVFLWLSGLTWIGYYDSLNVVFHFDDIPFILENPIIRDLDGIIKKFFELTNSRRAIPILTLYLNYTLHGFEVPGYHIVNICIHALNGFLIFLLISQLLPSVYGGSSVKKENVPTAFSIKLTAISIASIFTVHPLLTASVTYITQRSGQIATLFYVAAFISYLYTRKFSPSDKKFWGWLVFTLLCYWLAFKSKEMTLTWLLIPFAYEILSRFNDWSRLRNVAKWAALLLIIFSAVMTWYLLNSNYLSGNYFVGFGSKTLWGPWTQIETMARALVNYWKLLVIPLPQWMNIDHDFIPSRETIDAWALASLVLHILIVSAAIFSARKGFVLFALGVFWFYITFGPYIVVPERDLLVEYKSYLPSVGLMLIFAELLFWLQKKLASRQYYLYAGVLIIIVLGIMGTWERNAVYATTASAWKDAINKAPYKARTLHNLGYAYAQDGHLNAGKVYFQKSLQMSPGFVLARLNLARVYIRDGAYQEGLAEYSMMIKLASEFPTGELAGLMKDAYHEMGDTHARQRKYLESIPYYQKSLQIENTLKTNLALGKIYLELNKLEEARNHLRVVMNHLPNAPDINLNMGIIALKLQKLDEALQWFLRTIELSPNHPDAYNNLAIVHAMKGNITASIQAFEKVLQISPNHKEAIKNLNALKKQLSSASKKQ